MVYDTLCWGEAQAASGLVAFAALANQNHKNESDKIVLKSDPDPPWLQGFGFLSDTKPQASALVPDDGNGGKPYYGPGGMNFSRNGWAQFLAHFPIKLLKGDKITGQASNTNVNEGGVIGAHIAYGKPVKPLDITMLADIRSRYDDVFLELITITSTVAVTYNSGAVDLKTGATNTTNWFDPEASYEILGVLQHLGAATFGGIENITQLGGDWKQSQPGIPVNPLSAVTFGNGEAFSPALEPIPFKGDSVPNVGMTATSAGAITFAQVIGRLP